MRSIVMKKFMFFSCILLCCLPVSAQNSYKSALAFKTTVSWADYPVLVPGGRLAYGGELQWRRAFYKDQYFLETGIGWADRGYKDKITYTNSMGEIISETE